MLIANNLRRLNKRGQKYGTYKKVKIRKREKWVDANFFW